MFLGINGCAPALINLPKNCPSPIVPPTINIAEPVVNTPAPSLPPKVQLPHLSSIPCKYALCFDANGRQQLFKGIKDLEANDNKVRDMYTNLVNHK